MRKGRKEKMRKGKKNDEERKKRKMTANAV